MLAYTLNWLLASFLNGIFFFLLFLFLFYWFYLKELPVQTPPVSPQFEEFSLSSTVQEMLLKNLDSTSDLGMAGLNMLFQFLFQELKDTKAVRRYIIRKMSAEFKELLSTKAAGKIVNKITARDFSLGTSFPVIHSLKLYSYQMDKARKSIQELSLLLDIEYRDGFSLSIDADLILGRSAYVHVKIACIRGKARLQFTRHPFTHWNFAFVEEPHIDFAATSHFDGRQIPQLTTLILNQLRRSVRRKHTLPNYKCRFKPFFDQIYTQNLYKANLDEMFAAKTAAASNEENERKQEEAETAAAMVPTTAKAASQGTPPVSKQYRKLCDSLGFELHSSGELAVKMKLCERLPESLCSLNTYQTAATTPTEEASAAPATPDMPLIYFTMSVDTLSMQALMSKQVCKEHWPVYEFELARTSLNQSLGIVFLEVFFVNRTEVAVQRIFPNSLASQALAEDSLRQFDIVFSLNQTRVTNIKSLNKILQKTPLQQPLKFVVQRPCIILDEETASRARRSLLAAMTPSPTLDNIASVTNSPTPSTTATATMSTSSALYTSLRGRLQRKINQLSSNTTDNIIPPNGEKPSLPTSSSTDNFLVATTSSPSSAAAAAPPILITNTASSNCLVDYFTSNEPVPELDLMSLLLGETKSSARGSNNTATSSSFFKTREIRLDRENLVTFSNVPVQLGESYAFDLSQLGQTSNGSTKYLNLFLWTVQNTNKNTKTKNLLLGYISLPLHEILVDCWNTSKGETQSTLHLRPLDDLKASASAARTPRHSHVLAEHPGFDATLAVGSVTLQFQHKLKSSSTSNSIADTVVGELVDVNNVETEFRRNETAAAATAMSPTATSTGLMAPALSDIPDDGSIHKFMQVQFNENVICEFCNKKIWMKNAYQCIYCGYVIHLKCYEKTIGKTICARFFANNNNKKQEDEQLPSKPERQVSSEDYLQAPVELRERSGSTSPSRGSLASSAAADASTTARITNFISGIRHRRWHNPAEGAASSPTTTNTTSTVATTSTRAALLSSLNSRIANSSRLSKLSNKLQYLRSGENKSDSPSNSTLVAETTPSITTEDNVSLETTDEDFKDFDSAEGDKLFGVELYEDLPPHERKQKFEETIVKYRTTIDMMSNIKADLEKELGEATKAQALAQQEQLRTQIKHLEEQMKGVVFLLMQCQIGLETCNELLGRSPSPPKRPNEEEDEEQEEDEEFDDVQENKNKPTTNNVSPISSSSSSSSTSPEKPKEEEA